MRPEDTDSSLCHNHSLSFFFVSTLNVFRFPDLPYHVTSSNAVFTLTWGRKPLALSPMSGSLGVKDRQVTQFCAAAPGVTTVVTNKHCSALKSYSSRSSFPAMHATQLQLKHAQRCVLPKCLHKVLRYIMNTVSRGEWELVSYRSRQMKFRRLMTST